MSEPVAMFLRLAPRSPKTVRPINEAAGAVDARAASLFHYHLSTLICPSSRFFEVQLNWCQRWFTDAEWTQEKNIRSRYIPNGSNVSSPIQSSSVARHQWLRHPSTR